MRKKTNKKLQKLKKEQDIWLAETYGITGRPKKEKTNWKNEYFSSLKENCEPVPDAKTYLWPKGKAVKSGSFNKILYK